MQIENIIKSATVPFAILTDQIVFRDRFLNTDVQIVSKLISNVTVLAVDLKTTDLVQKIIQPECINIFLSAQKIIYICESNDLVPVDLLILRTADLIISADDLQIDCYLRLNEKLQQSNQDQVYLNLAAELNSEYEILKSELEKKISDHQKNLIESRQKILESNNRNETLRKILYALYQESDIARIETLLNELLPAASNATWVKIIQIQIQSVFESDLAQQLGLSFQFYDLNPYLIYFIKGDQKNFKKTDLELFQKIRDALLLNLTRNQNLSDLVLAEKILTEAFETFPHHLAIIDSEYRLLSSNQSAAHNPNDKCYQILFNSSVPCKGCHFGQKFQIEQNAKNYEVTSNAFLSQTHPESDSGQKKMWVHTYKDSTEEIYFEQRMTQNEKMKDLGLISSSIAHELNNPLGGIISYLQILQMEINKESDLQPDLQAMIQTSFKMKKIIEDLLVFSRRPEILNPEPEIVSSLIQESLSENEILFKAENIKIAQPLEKTDWIADWSVVLSKSAFKNSIYFIFQFFIERARNIKMTKQNFTGLVEIKFYRDKFKNTVRFIGNFGPLENNYKLKNVQLLAIHKTLIDQGLHVELTELDKTWVAVDVIFSSDHI